MKLLMFINPKAGKGHSLKDTQYMKQVLLENGIEAEMCMTHDEAEMRERVKGLSSICNVDALACVGGDGTLNRMINAMQNFQISLPLGYIPAGTTNDFARTLELPITIEAFAEAVSQNRTKPIDIGKFGDSYFIYVASFGAFTQSSYNTDQSMKNALGHFAYVIEGFKELPGLKSYHATIETENGDFEGDYVFGAVSNSASIGGLIKIDESLVDLSDGMFEATLVKMPRNIIDVSKIVFAIKSGNYESELIEFFHCNQMTIRCDEAMPWSLDGEYEEGGKQIVIKNQKHAVKFIC